MENKPVYYSDKFECPHCKVLAQQSWFDSSVAGQIVERMINFSYLDYRENVADYKQKAIEEFITAEKTTIKQYVENAVPSGFSIAACVACKEITMWLSGSLIYPKKISLAQPNSDMNEDIKSLYLEAATIFLDSPKGATALLRLALQKLLKQIGKNGKDINQDIKELVSNGLNPKIQQALDILRVVGNNAVHPGQIDIDDNSEIAVKLFQILNFIAEEMISKPKELEKLYDDIIPESSKEHIKQRDGK